MEKKKLSLKKETITKLDDMSQIKGGGTWDVLKDTVTIVASTVLGAVTCAVGTVVMATAEHCPTAQTDCNTCVCETRWCMS